MKVTVIATERGNRFLCENTFAGEMTSEVLFASEDNMRASFTITRANEIIAQGLLNWVRGECPMFDFSTHLPNNPDARTLQEFPATMLEIGDELEVYPPYDVKPGDDYDRFIWLTLIAPSYIPRPQRRTSS